ncbi:hypothetical protein MKW98_023776 [Papaver atlanticum]|uniref:Uncharacterized protein n=1 Tax=Papaver atlanticum TaxID=357466 RepID=A0AAD4XL21_9MAGN|nr:hypothetical protein MKW98_023776 [Papaver atlanticum]
MSFKIDTGSDILWVDCKVTPQLISWLTVDVSRNQTSLEIEVIGLLTCPVNAQSMTKPNGQECMMHEKIIQNLCSHSGGATTKVSVIGQSDLGRHCVCSLVITNPFMIKVLAVYLARLRLPQKSEPDEMQSCIAIGKCLKEDGPDRLFSPVWNQCEDTIACICWPSI